jgi:hypothetical protein
MLPLRASADSGKLTLLLPKWLRTLRGDLQGG